MKNIQTQIYIYIICLMVFLGTINRSQADVIMTDPLHDPFAVKVLNRGCSKDKYAKLKITNMVIPNYPIDMRKEPTQGVVGITFNLNHNGNPENIKVLFASNPSFKTPVLETVREWKFDCGKLTEEEKQVLKDAKFTYTFEFILNPMNIEIGDPFN